MPRLPALVITDAERAELERRSRAHTTSQQAPAPGAHHPAGRRWRPQPADRNPGRHRARCGRHLAAPIRQRAAQGLAWAWVCRSGLAEVEVLWTPRAVLLQARDWGVPADLLENEIGKQQLALAKRQGTEHDRSWLRAKFVATVVTQACREMTASPHRARSQARSSASWTRSSAQGWQYRPSRRPTSRSYPSLKKARSSYSSSGRTSALRPSPRLLDEAGPRRGCLPSQRFAIRIPEDTSWPSRSWRSTPTTTAAPSYSYQPPTTPAQARSDVLVSSAEQHWHHGRRPFVRRLCLRFQSDGTRSSWPGSGCGQTWSVGIIHSSPMAVWRGRVTM
jgi:hypothetical protein